MGHVIHHDLDGNFVTRYCSGVLSEYLPRRVKRLFYIGSLVSFICQDSPPEMSWLDRLNVALRLASTTTGLLPAIYLAKRIWKGIDLNSVPLPKHEIPIASLKDAELEENDCWRIGLYLTRKSPEWIRYGSVELMTTDVHDFLRHCPQYRPAQPHGAV